MHSATTQSFRIELQGLNCAACAGRAEAALRAVEGVVEASVSIADHSAQLQVQDAAAQDIRAALAKAGYPARTDRFALVLEGLSCAGCAGRVEKALAALPGALDVGVNFADRTAQVTVLHGASDLAAAIAAVRGAGYQAAALPQDHAARPDTDPAAQEAAQAGRQALLAGALTLPVFVLEMGSHMIPAFHHWVMHTLGTQTSWLIQFVLVSCVLAGPGSVFLRRGLPALWRGHPEMNSLVAMGSLAAWGYSSVALFWPTLLPEAARAVYFEAAAVIVTLILVGRWLEARARGQAGAAIRALAGLQPQEALVDRPGGPVLCPIAEIAVGDVIHLRPGERVAVDGVVSEGQSLLDESMITGEPGSVLRQPGDTVVAGTVNGSGALQYTAQAVGADTVLARIVSMVRQAQGAKLPIQSLADRVVARFVPAVLVIAALTIATWLMLGPDPALPFALVAGVSVLIIACPCAMGLATPTSIIAGTGRAAQLGILFRKGEALQRLEGAAVVAFDKTGTLTLGRPRLTRIETAKGWDRATVLPLIGAAEARSEHPIARALTEAAQADYGPLPPAQQVEALQGLGLRAQVQGKDLLIGSPRLMRDQGLNLAAWDTTINTGQNAGQSVILAAIDGQIAALLTVADTPRPEAQAVIRALHAQGLRTAMITGDSAPAAQAIGAQLGLDDIRAEVLPGGKKDAVAALRAAHGPVVFVGDGINDAPALAAADVGIAMGTGTDVAIESADVVLAGGRLGAVPTALALSRRTMTNIRQNLFWAFGYNITLIPVAAGALYPVTGTLLSPILAAAAMALSSVFVVTNALRLRGFRPQAGTGPEAKAEAEAAGALTSAQTAAE